MKGLMTSTARLPHCTFDPDERQCIESFRPLVDEPMLTERPEKATAESLQDGDGVKGGTDSF